MDHHMRAIPLLADYCGDGNPVIVEQFAERWVRQIWRKRASASWLRKLRSEGVTHVAVEVAPGRAADFTVGELIRSGVAQH